MTHVYYMCAADAQTAIAMANSQAIIDIKPYDQNIQGTTCVATAKTTTPDYPPLDDQPSCDVISGDDACVACAKTSCCADYQACFGEMNCSCLVGCLYQGNSIQTCTTDCGAPSAASVATAKCLAGACPSQCDGPGDMGSGMCGPSMSTGSGGSGGSGGPSCSPGPHMAGESCASDWDCASCACDLQTLLCD